MKKEVAPKKKPKNATDLQKPKTIAARKKAAPKKVVKAETIPTTTLKAEMEKISAPVKTPAKKARKATKKATTKTKTPRKASKVKEKTLEDHLHEPVVLIPLAFVLLFAVFALWTSIIPTYSTADATHGDGIVLKDAVYAKNSRFLRPNRSYSIAIKYPEFGRSTAVFAQARQYMMNDISAIVTEGIEAVDDDTRVVVKGEYTIGSSHSYELGEVLSVLLTITTDAYNTGTGENKYHNTVMRSYNISLTNQKMIWLSDITVLNPQKIETLAHEYLRSKGVVNTADIIRNINTLCAVQYGHALPFTVHGESITLYIDDLSGGYSREEFSINVPLDADIEIKANNNQEEESLPEEDTEPETA